MDPAIEELINQRVAAAIAAYEATRNGEGDGEAAGGQATVAQGCSYKEFLHCKPINFSGIEGTVGLVRWFEKLESVFRISRCADNNRVKYATCTLLDGALTWWNTYAQSVGIDAAYETSWENFRQMMTEEYCPRNEVKKLEAELWNLRLKGTDVTGYTQRFQELALLCPTMVTPEYKRIETYIQGLSPQIQGGVTSSDPQTIQAAIRMAHKLMDQAILQGTVAKSIEGNVDGKRKWNENQGKNFVQHPNKRQEMIKTDDAGQNDRKRYAGNLPKCNKCDRHHTGPCTIVCNRCKKVGHMARDCRSAAPVTNAVAQRACYECGVVGHFRNNCPKLKKQNTGPAQGRVYMITDEETHQDVD